MMAPPNTTIVETTSREPFTARRLGSLIGIERLSYHPVRSKSVRKGGSGIPGLHSRGAIQATVGRPKSLPSVGQPLDAKQDQSDQYEGRQSDGHAKQCSRSCAGSINEVHQCAAPNKEQEQKAKEEVYIGLATVSTQVSAHLKAYSFPAAETSSSMRRRRARGQ